ncbi:MAG: hypothetical protein RH917_06235 [Lacipirellulaceae bacterium]
MNLESNLLEGRVENSGSVATNSGSLKPWHLLLVEGDVVDAMKTKLALHERLPVDSTLHHVTAFSSALSHLEGHAADAILVGYSFVESQTDAPLQELIQNPSGVPVVILSGESHTDAVMRAGRLGARDFLSKDRVTGEAIVGALRPIVLGSEGKAEGNPDERRMAARHDSVAAAVVLPIDAAGKPGSEIPASVVNISRLGIGVLVERDPQDIPDLCVIGVEDRSGSYHYASVEWRNRRLALPAVHLGGKFLTGEDDPLDARQLTPQFDAKRLRYSAPMDAEVIREWRSVGVLRSSVVDRVKSCSKCYSLLSYRDGCPDCGSFDTEPTPLIHHFACAHVAAAEEFGLGQIACPKCRSGNLVVGADYEYLAGPRRCRECSWSDSELVLIAECMGCGKRSNSRETVEKDVVAYYVNRLDPLDFIPDTH